ncbi:MAG: ATP-dependent helicase [Lachnospiraceae bacterium]|nr:ATP-dependent helicase [Lachnospiraceae bacterium]
MNEFNASQADAIRHRDGPALVLAGPGSGKTFTIIKRLENLISSHQKDPSSILTITYTTAAAGEMRARAYSLIGAAAGQAVFGTFHSIFYSILRNSFSINASNILKPYDKYMILTDIAVKTGIDSRDMKSLADELSAMISRRKNGCQALSCFDDDVNDRIFTLYNERLKELRLIDFDDMIIKCRELFLRDGAVLKRWRERYRYIQIDEFQDINDSQYDVVKLLAGEDGNILAVGDDDQSIYGFRGAGPGIMQRFIEDYPMLSRYELNMNYRCSKAIAEAADRVIEKNTVRIKKHHESFVQTGEAVDIRCLKDRDSETDAIAGMIDKSRPGDYAVLVRTNDLRELFEEALGKRGIPVISRGREKGIYASETAKDIRAYLRLASGCYDRADILRAVNKPMRYISREAFGREGADINDACVYYRGQGSVYNNAVRLAADLKRMGSMRPANALRYLMKVVGYEAYLKKESGSAKELYRLYEISKSFGSVTLWLKKMEESLFKKRDTAPDDKNDAGVSVMTLHASKGLEFREVFIVDVNEGIIPYHKAKLKEETEEERRLLYVGMTRAISRLHLFYIEESFGKKMRPSPFLDQS